MTNKKTTRRALFSSFMALLLCCSMLVGTTFAWFTDSVTSAGNIIKSGTLNVEMYWADGKADPDADTTVWNNADSEVNPDNGTIFKNDLWEPGYAEVRHIKIKNTGTLALKYQLGIKANGEVSKLTDVIDVHFADPAVQVTDRAMLTAGNKVDTLTKVLEGMPGNTSGTLLADSEVIVTLGLKMQESAGNDYQNLSVGSDFEVCLVATQMTYEKDSFDELYDENAEYPKLETVDAWDGTADTSWYDPANPQTAYDISTAEQLAGLAQLVSEETTFKGVTFTLTNDINLYCEDTTPSADGDPLTFRPIGDHSKNGTFEGIFDGNGKAISNLYQNGWDLGYQWGAYGSYGLFGNLNDATVKNLTITGAESYIEGGDVGGITGSATGTCVFENITIKDSDFATYNNGNGGIIGWSGAGNYTFKNIKMDKTVTLAGLWGSFDSSIGGIVGQGEPGATYNFENVDIACRLDAYNDCTASYDYYNYRMCGMIIGRLAKTTTIDGVKYPDMSKYNITCNDVTVTYDDWANYHYCEPTPGLNGGRGMRVEPGYAYGGLPADYDHSQCTTHHMNLLPFDQIFGGDQLGVKGLKEYTGVTVIYNNK